MEEIISTNTASIPAEAVKTFCQGLNRKGKPCKKETGSGEKYCYYHSSGPRKRWKALTRNQSMRLIFGSFFGVAMSLVAIYWHFYPLEHLAQNIDRSLRVSSTDNRQQQFYPGRCRSNVPEATQNIQWTWLLDGANFGCMSNAFESWTTIDFAPEATEAVVIQSDGREPIFGRGIHMLISWYSSRSDGAVKWVVSTACPNFSESISPIKYHDLPAIVEAPDSVDRRKASEINFQYPNECDGLDSILIKVARHGAEKEDTLKATARITLAWVDFEQGFLR
jgi:hypothetical protein